MSKNLYITTTEAKSGKSLISLGLMELLKADLGRVAFFRPIINVKNVNAKDRDIDLIMTHFNLNQVYQDSYAFTFPEAEELINSDRDAELIDVIIGKCKKLEEKYDFVLIEGTDFAGVTSAFEFDINAELANNLGAPVLLVMNARLKSAEDAVSALHLAVESFEEKGCSILGAILTRVAEKNVLEANDALAKKLKEHGKLLYYVLPEQEMLGMLTMQEIKDALNARVLYGEDQLMRHAHHHVVAAMHLGNFLDHVVEGTLVITPGDRADIVVGSVISANSTSFPHIMGLVLTGNLTLNVNVINLIGGLAHAIPILSVKTDTLRTISSINEIDCKISPNDKKKINTALALFEANVNTSELREKIIVTKSEIMTPKMFEFGIIQKARAFKQHIVLPEGAEERILRAAEMLLHRDVVDITLLGDETEIRNAIKRLGLKMENAKIINTLTSDKLERYAETYMEARKHKGISLGMARDAITDVSYFGTMMVHLGDADGMVSGAVHTTQHTIRPSFEFVKTKPGISLVSSVFFMCLEDRVLVYGDCAVNPNPNADELAEIAIASAQTARVFGVEPRVAMLSYSTGESGKGEEVEKVREATRIAKARAPELKLEGPIQYDAAVDLEVAKTKMPNSEVAGRATVFIFPDLNTGNNTYKAVQRSANAVAIGPVLQGLNKPVNDLSRGCTVPDIVNTVAITAIQAQAER